MISRAVMYWAVNECERQQSGERSVAWMVDGWLYAHRRVNQPVSLGDILALGRIVEPRHNSGGLRLVNATVGHDLMTRPSLVLTALNQLIDAQDVLTADEWYYRYEEIHPFTDGNGRTGSILWNWLRKSLPEPEAPPDFWGDDPLYGKPVLKPRDWISRVQGD